MHNFNNDFSGYLLQELNLAGAINESAIKLHEARELFESNAINQKTVDNYHFKIGDENFNVTWEDFKMVYLNYKTFPTITQAMARFGVTVDMFGQSQSFNTMANRLVQHWVKYNNPEAVDLADQLGSKHLPYFKDRGKILARATKNEDGTFTPATMDDIDRGKRGRVNKGSRTITMLNGQDVVPGEFYNDISRIPKYRYTGWISIWERIVRAGNIKSYFGRKWKKTFIMGYAFNTNSVVEVWYNSATSNFSLHDANGVELGNPTATLQESTRLFVTFLLKEYDSDRKVFIGNKNMVATSYMNALNKAGSSTTIETQREDELAKLERRNAARKRLPVFKKVAAAPPTPSRIVKIAKAAGAGAASLANRAGSDFITYAEKGAEKTLDLGVAGINATREKQGAARDRHQSYNDIDDKVRQRTQSTQGSNWTSGDINSNRTARPEASREITPATAAALGFNPSVVTSKDTDIRKVLEPIKLPTAVNMTRPSVDGLNDYERNMALSLYSKYKQQQAQNEKDVKDYNAKAAKLRVLDSQFDKLGEMGKAQVNRQKLELANERKMAHMSADALIQLMADIEMVKKTTKGKEKTPPAKNPKPNNKKINENFSSMITSYDTDMVNRYSNSLEHDRTLPAGVSGDDVSQFNSVISHINSDGADRDAVSRRNMAQSSNFTTSAIKTSIVEDMITTYEVTRAERHMRQLTWWGNFFLRTNSRKAPGFIRKFTNLIRIGRPESLHLPTDKPVWYDRVGMVFRGTLYRSDFVIGFSLKDQIDIEVWYITEPAKGGKTVSSYYVYDVTAGMIVRSNLPYYRNAIQTVLAKIGVE